MRKHIHYFFFSFYFLIQSLNAYQYNLSICTIFQNEAPYLKEWIEFHRLVGVEHFYLFNHLSTDEYQKVLKPYVETGIVDVFDWPYEFKSLSEWNQIQVCALNEGLLQARDATKWLAIIDSDEFLFPLKENNLIQFLASYEDSPYLGGLCVNWVMYGTSHIKKIPDQHLLIETLVLSNRSGSDHFKSIVRPERVNKIFSPHTACYQAGFKAYQANGVPAIPPFVDIEKIRINHYWSRDEDYLHHVKIPRRTAWGTSAEICLFWNSLNNMDYNPAILRFVDPLKKRMLN